MNVNRLFSPHMVLQQEKPIIIWGEGLTGETIQVTLKDEKQTTTVENGKWQVMFPAMKAQTDLRITVTGKDNSIVIDDVAVGEVFVAGGQSNMEFFMRYDEDYAQEVKVCDNPNIRFYDVPEVSYAEQEQDFDYSRMGFWRICNKENLEFYSAVAYYCARNLQRDRQVPIGIIGCNWGGTVAVSWMSDEYVKRHGQIWKDEYLEAIRDVDDEKYRENYRKNPLNGRGNLFADEFSEVMLRGISREQQLLWMKDAPPIEDDFFKPGPYHPNTPGILYENMVKKIIPYPVRGVLWYQGESDETHADIYKEVLSDMIDCWRESWGCQLPFFCVQLAPFEVWLDNTGEKYPVLRQQQQMLADEKDEVYLISSSDAGLQYDIHPKKKQPIGERLALSIRGHLYGEKVLCEAPRGKELTWDNDTLWISFVNAEGGLLTEGRQIEALQLIGNKEDADALIDPKGYSVFVNDEKIGIRFEKPMNYTTICVKFARSPYYTVNLYNKAGIPAVPFELKIQR